MAAAVVVDTMIASALLGLRDSQTQGAVAGEALADRLEAFIEATTPTPVATVVPINRN